MQTSPFVAALRREVAAAAGDAATSPVVERVAASLEAAARLWLLDVAGQAADQVNVQLPGGHVEVRLDRGEPALVYVDEPAPEPAAPAGENYAARITLRLPEALKAQVESWAAADGVSVNTWLVRAIARGGQPPRRSPGRRMTGYGVS